MSVDVNRIEAVYEGLQKIQDLLAAKQGNLSEKDMQKVQKFIQNAVGVLGLVAVNFPPSVEAGPMLQSIRELRMYANSLSKVQAAIVGLSQVALYALTEAEEDYQEKRDAIVGDPNNPEKGLRIREAQANAKLKAERAKVSALRRLLEGLKALGHVVDEKLKLLSKTSYELQTVYNATPDRILSRSGIIPTT